MLLIPAIDLKDGQCVRLRQGRMDDATVYSDDPVAVAQQWIDAGARRLHMVDLNGAFDGQPVNAECEVGHTCLCVGLGAAPSETESIAFRVETSFDRIFCSPRHVHFLHAVYCASVSQLAGVVPRAPILCGQRQSAVRDDR